MKRTIRWHLTALRIAAITTLIALPTFTPPAAHADDGRYFHWNPDNDGFSLMFDAQGWHPIGPGWNYECVMQAD